MATDPWAAFNPQSPSAPPMQPRQPTVPEMVVAPQPRQAAPVDPLVQEGRMLENELRRRRLAEGGGPEAEQATAEERRARIKTALDNLTNLEAMVKGSEMGTGSIVGQESFRAGDDYWGLSSLFNQRANDVSGAIEMVQGDLINQVRNEMQESGSPIGVKGADTEKEASRLAASIANLAQTQDEGEFLIGVKRARDYYARRLAALGGLPADDPTGPAPPPDEDGLSGVVTDETPSPYDPGGPLNPGNGNPGGGRFLGDLGDAVQSTAAGLAQGPAGLYDLAMDASTGVQRGVNWALNKPVGAALDAVGLPAAGDWWRRGADANDAALANTPSAVDAIEQISPTPQGHEAARFVSQLVGGAAVPFGPKAAPRIQAPTAAPAAPNAAREVIDAGARNNVRVMTSDVRPPTTFIGKNVRTLGERIPYAGTGGQRAAQQNERVEAVRELARETGADVATELLDEVADDFAKTRGSQVTALTRRKNAVIDSIPTPLAPANVSRTLEVIGAQTRRLASIDAEAFAPVIDRLTRFGANIASGKTLREIEGNRKLLGDMFEDASLASIKGDGQKALNAIYAPLRDDMAEFIQANAGTEARTTWANANKHLSTLMGELDDKVFAGVLRSSEATPENIGRLLFSRKPSEVGRLVSNLSPEGRTKAQAAIIEHAITKAGGIDNISPDRFANEIGRLGKSVGVVFEGADLARVRGLERLLQATKQASVASAAPPTGAQNMPFLMGAGVGLSGGALAVPLGTVGGLARLYESAAVRNMLVGLGRSQPGSKAEGRMLERILKVVTSQTQIRGPAANDVIAQSPARLAAQDQELN